MLDLNVAVTQVAKRNAADRTARGIPGEPECVLVSFDAAPLLGGIACRHVARVLAQQAESVCIPQIYPFDPHA